MLLNSRLLGKNCSSRQSTDMDLDMFVVCMAAFFFTSQKKKDFKKICSFGHMQIIQKFFFFSQNLHDNLYTHFTHT
jgi:hypothetical protein